MTIATPMGPEQMTMAQQCDLTRAGNRKALLTTIEMRSGISTRQLLAVADPFGQQSWSDHLVELKVLRADRAIASSTTSITPDTQWFPADKERLKAILWWPYPQPPVKHDL